MLMKNLKARMTNLRARLKKLEDDLAAIEQKRKKDANEEPKSTNDESESTIEMLKKLAEDLKESNFDAQKDIHSALDSMESDALSNAVEFDATKIDDAATSDESDESTGANDAASNEAKDFEASSDSDTTALRELLDTLSKKDETKPEMEELVQISLEDVLSKMAKDTLDTSDNSDDSDKRGNTWNDSKKNKDHPMCKDHPKFKYCWIFKNRNQCHSTKKVTELMVKFCGKTCGLCSTPKMPACSYQTFGCCNDKITTKKDADGSNCPRCKDQFKNLCKMFAEDCERHTKAGSFMREKCPATCDKCKPACEDTIEFKHICPYWENTLGWCKIPNSSKDYKKLKAMKHYCSKTCGFC